MKQSRTSYQLIGNIMYKWRFSEHVGDNINRKPQFVLCLEEKQVNIVAIDFGKQEHKCKTSNRMQD